MQAGEVGASGDVVAGAQGAIVTSKDLRVEDGTVLLTFPRLPHPPSCLDSLELRMRVAGGGGTTLGAYPSIESTAHELADGDALGGTLLRSNRPRSTADVSAAGQVAVWDVLPHYGADIFMRSTTADPDDHFALAVRPLTANGTPRRHVRCRGERRRAAPVLDCEPPMLTGRRTSPGSFVQLQAPLR